MTGAYLLGLVAVLLVILLFNYVTNDKEREKIDRFIASAKHAITGSFAQLPQVEEGDTDEEGIQSELEKGTLYRRTLGIEVLLGFPRMICLTLLVGVPIVVLIYGVLSIPVIFYAIAQGSFSPLTTLFGSIFWCGTPLLVIAGLCVGYGNIILSFLSLRGMKRGEGLTRWAIGAREPSRREDAKINAVFDSLNGQGFGSLLLHNDYFVIDYDVPNAYTLGTTLYLTRGAVESDFLGALIAHEMGHLENGDGRVLKALRDFVYPYVQHVLTSTSRMQQGTLGVKTERIEENSRLFFAVASQITTLMFSLMFGGYGVVIMARRWAEWFRVRDFLADKHAFELGYGEQLIEFLEMYKQFDIAVPYSASWTQYTELRIDRLLLLLGR